MLLLMIAFEDSEVHGSRVCRHLGSSDWSGGGLCQRSLLASGHSKPVELHKREIEEMVLLL